MSTILVTGGAGYIGSHTCLELLNANFDVVVFDNLCNSNREAITRVETLTGRSIPFVEGDICNKSQLREVFVSYNIDAVIHFAGLKAVGESAELPLNYYENNVGGTVYLAQVMEEFGCESIVFSSSATVYGEKAPIPYVETLPTAASNVYGRTKLMVEELLKDCCAKPSSPWRVSLLRYFNPIGAHESGRIGEDPQGIPNNLLPYVAQVAVGKRPFLRIFGDDYDTRDGTGVRDYIHVVDLAKGHVKAVQKLLSLAPGWRAYNLGAGVGYSVLEVVKAFENAAGKAIPYEVMPRREGDLPEFFADPTRALEELGWKAELGLETMVEDTWRWQSNNPNGYEG
ncbi:UDP-glucose 4-epimerase GalE [Marinibactrum halimedae]|uniref:UDP-glucose 4-epimerase n=1 Tax=Marinibactrum halimedae TaxID=1444977 RepID=A0AA37WP45_9GAMM|nr:UDP-glucose 4-epimerase GalE [Marinibactrum halimedae]MCD9459556.1 UDP-glucose 4-epimerase GalE [Marinibactrum halimedae]GLS25627.1 UDP-glucose 4-epimerase [Marinibactrum halimedae]